MSACSAVGNRSALYHTGIRLFVFTSAGNAGMPLHVHDLDYDCYYQPYDLVTNLKSHSYKYDQV